MVDTLLPMQLHLKKCVNQPRSPILKDSIGKFLKSPTNYWGADCRSLTHTLNSIFYTHFKFNFLQIYLKSMSPPGGFFQIAYNCFFMSEEMFFQRFLTAEILPTESALMETLWVEFPDVFLQITTLREAT